MDRISMEPIKKLTRPSTTFSLEKTYMDCKHFYVPKIKEVYTTNLFQAC